MDHASVARLATSAGGGGSASRPTPGELTFLARTSKASPLLLGATTSGRHLRSALLSVVYVGERPRPQFEVNLEDVLVSGYEIHTDSTDARPLDLMSLSFGKITFTVYTQNADASTGDTGTSSWNFRTNSAN
jgi:type VI protein secretion system component Hcp